MEIAKASETKKEQNVIEFIVSRKTKDADFTFKGTKFQKFLFFTSLAFAALTVMGAVAIYWQANDLLKLSTLIALLASGLFTIFYQMSEVARMAKNLRNIEREMSMPLIQEFNEDIELIDELVKKYELSQLLHAKTSYAILAKQLRERIGITVGALEKIGIIPLVVTTCLSFAQFKKDELDQFGGLEWVSLSLIFLYLFAVRVSVTVHWMEKISGLLDLAVALKQNKKNGASSVPSRLKQVGRI